MGVFTASLRSACSLRCRHFVNNLKKMAQAILLTGHSMT
ncbi:gluconate 5-dehydrogenase [Yersinia pseudotuberculosis]|nr:gluconate 5-dehydrogenase [Yersinia pseudotuberculosis]